MIETDIMKKHNIDEVIVSEQQIRMRNRELVSEMASDYKGGNLVLIGILRGSFIFLADLVRQFFREDIHPRIDFMTLESYAGTESTGDVRIAKDFSIDVTDSQVIIIDDILDTGRTLKRADHYIMSKGAASVKTCVLLDKPERRAVEYHSDYVGFRIENKFVVGYGLDCDGLYRDLPYIARIQFE